MNELPENKTAYSFSFRVRQEHLDQLNHVNNIVYLQWVQEASEQHWNKLADEKIRTETIWMALRHEIDYLKQAFLDDEITIYTWVDDAFGVKSTRIVHIYHKATLLVKCRTTWLLLDAKTLRPKRINKEILALFEIL